MHVLIVGLPRGAVNLLDGAIANRNLRADRILADTGRRGTLMLWPRPEHCIYQLNSYLNEFSADGDYSKCQVLVLPYAELDEKLDDELNELASMGAKIERPVADGSNKWPQLRSKRSNQPFEALLVEQLAAHFLLPLVPRPPAEHIYELSQNVRNLLIAENALDKCNDVTPNRYSFFCQCADIFVEILANGLSGRMEDFCEDKGVKHAQNSPIVVTVTQIIDGYIAESVKTETHLKRGDKTSPQSAARLYYHMFTDKQETYIAILYAGPHPEGSFSCRVTVPN